jgi:hypothetical protein
MRAETGGNASSKPARAKSGKTPRRASDFQPAGDEFTESFA